MGREAGCCLGCLWTGVNFVFCLWPITGKWSCPVGFPRDASNRAPEKPTHMFPFCLSKSQGCWWAGQPETMTPVKGNQRSFGCEHDGPTLVYPKPSINFLGRNAFSRLKPRQIVRREQPSSVSNGEREVLFVCGEQNPLGRRSNGSAERV